jgi:hypothetical protein
VPVVDVEVGVVVIGDVVVDAVLVVWVVAAVDVLVGGATVLTWTATIGVCNGVLLLGGGVHVQLQVPPAAVIRVANVLLATIRAFVGREGGGVEGVDVGDGFAKEATVVGAMETGRMIGGPRVTVVAGGVVAAVGLLATVGEAEMSVWEG